jgi:hypothetical protein
LAKKKVANRNLLTKTLFAFEIWKFWLISTHTLTIKIRLLKNLTTTNENPLCSSL